MRACGHSYETLPKHEENGVIGYSPIAWAWPLRLSAYAPISQRNPANRKPVRIYDESRTAQGQPLLARGDPIQRRRQLASDGHRQLSPVLACRVTKLSRQFSFVHAVGDF